MKIHGIYQEQFTGIFHGFHVGMIDCSRQRDRWTDWVPDETKCAAQFGVLLVMVSDGAKLLRSGSQPPCHPKQSRLSIFFDILDRVMVAFNLY